MEIFIIAMQIGAIAVVVFSLVLTAIYAGNRLLSMIERHRTIAKHDLRKLSARQDLDYNIFHAELTNPRKQLPPIPGEVVNPPFIDRCFDDDDEEDAR